MYKRQLQHASDIICPFKYLVCIEFLLTEGIKGYLQRILQFFRNWLLGFSNCIFQLFLVQGLCLDWQITRINRKFQISFRLRKPFQELDCEMCIRDRVSIVGVPSSTSSVIRSSLMITMTIPAGPIFFWTPP